jgi:hypothetical protein
MFGPGLHALVLIPVWCHWVKMLNASGVGL